MKNRKIKLILVLSAVLLLFFTSLSFYMSTVRIKKTIQETITNQNLEAAESIASNLDIDTYKKFLNNPEYNKHYSKISNYLEDAREKLDVLYVYILKIDNPKVSKIMIAGDLKDDLDFQIGEPCTVPEQQVKIAFYDEKPYITGVIEDPEYGNYLSVGAPIRDEADQVIGYLGIDISTKRLNKIEETVLENNIVIFLFSAVFILIMIASFYLLQRWYLKEVGDAEDTYHAEIKTLISSVSSLRHDFINHIQVVHGLLMIGEADKALHYLTSLSKEVQVIESIKQNIEHPGLAILLQSKNLVAQNHHIDMDINISQHPFDKVKTTDLIKIISNLIDNAIDAVNDLPEEKRKITVECHADEVKYVFKITNLASQPLNNELIFIQGYSTKEAEHGKIRGQGLFIVREIVQKYNGSISISSTNELEVTAIIEIPIK